MKKLNLPIVAILFTIMFTASSCEVIGGIFKAGVWVGVIIVVLIIALIAWLAGKSRK